MTFKITQITICTADKVPHNVRLATESFPLGKLNVVMANAMRTPTKSNQIMRRFLHRTFTFRFQPQRPLNEIY